MHGTGTLQNREGAKYEGGFYNGLRCGMLCFGTVCMYVWYVIC